ncbi:phosphodiesterase [Pseudomonas sp. CDFA 602]|uniref:phosphodiesterase n=1 Tax=Pseudomonas californiensis TaxID=2829823 RepID=UPI001E35A83E|nr:phosphodiesterase [Pseudomonas californiensis]MCD5996162.1 phosphodiesterase [Pseudomonas californiensis]MCD6001790.1 phosphodiesterase [Pseudomonas californiensis]
MLIAHLSDLHIRPNGVLYQGLVDSNAMCRQAIAHLNAIRPRPDVVVITGDVVDEGLPAEYEMASALLADIEQPLLMIPGNHDDRTRFRAAFAQAGQEHGDGPLHFIASGLGPVRIIGLDITVPGEHHGDMTEAAQTWLDAALAQEPMRPTLIMLHQPPFLSGIPYIDLYACHHADRLVQVVERYPAIERIVCGHIHRSMQLRFGGSLLCTAPSTTTAIALALDEEATEASYIEPPALLLHHWKPDTGLITHWVPIGDFPGPMPFA